MPADFTYDAYASLLDAVLDRGVSFVTVRDYIAGEDLPEGFVVLRHDVDRKPGNALDFARMEADRGVRSTYYVRTVEKTFDPEVVREIEALDHEVGYHYEDVDRTDGDLRRAHDSFATNLARLRRLATVETACMHGNPLTPHDNRDMWTVGPGFDAYDLLGEAYLSMDFTDVAYYSDTGRTWRDGALKIKDHPVRADGTITQDGKATQVASTPELAALIAASPDGRYCVLSHPDRWAGSSVEYASEAAFDAIKNVAKYAMQALPTG